MYIVIVWNLCGMVIMVNSYIIRLSFMIEVVVVVFEGISLFYFFVLFVIFRDVVLSE